MDDTAVIEDATVLLVLEQSGDSLSLVCEALAAHQVAENFEQQETILWVLSPAWKSGAVDIPALLHSVAAGGSESARRGVMIAREWLRISASLRDRGAVEQVARSRNEQAQIPSQRGTPARV